MNNRCKKNSSWVIGMILVYAVASIILVLLHEPWRDELQAWLISRDCSVAEIFKMMGYEGHFALWSLFLKPFAALGGGVICMNFFSMAVCCVAVFLILCKSNFAPLVKVFLTFSAPFFYWYAVIARPYSLAGLGVVLLCISWKYRIQKPLYCAFALAFLANTHVYMEGFAGIVFLFFAKDIIFGRIFTKEKIYSSMESYSALIIPALGAFVAFLQVLPCFFQTSEAQSKIQSVADVLPRIAFTLDTYANYFVFISNPAVRAFFWIVFVTLLVWIFYKSVRMGVIALCGVLWIFVFAAFLYSLTSQQQCYLTIAIFIFPCWVLADDEDRRLGSLVFDAKYSLPFCVFVLMSWYCTLQFAVLDTMYVFSSIRETAAFVNANVSTKDKIYMFPSALSLTGINAYTHRKLTSSEDLNDYTFTIFKSSFRKKTNAHDVVNSWNDSNGKMYALVNKRTNSVFLKSLPVGVYPHLLYKSAPLNKRMLSEESYFLYLCDTQKTLESPVKK